MFNYRVLEVSDREMGDDIALAIILEAESEDGWDFVTFIPGSTRRLIFRKNIEIKNT